MRVVAFMVLILSAHVAWAQKEPVPVKEKFKLFKSKVSKQLDKTDTVKLPGLKDSFQLSAPDSVNNKNFLTGLKSKADTLRPELHQPDTIKRFGFEKPALGLDSIRQPGIPNVDALAEDSLKQKVLDASDKVNQKAADVQGLIRNKTDSLKLPGELKDLKEKINPKVDVKLHGDLPGDGLKIPSNDENQDVNIPELPVDQLQIPGTDPSTDIPGMPDVKLPDQKNNQVLPDVKLPDQKSNISELPNLDVAGNVKEKLDLPSDLPQLEKPDSSQVEELKEKALQDERLKKYAEPVSEISDRLDPYKKNVDSLTVKDAGEIAANELESNASKINGLQEIDANSKAAKAAMAMPQQAALLQRYQDKKILKEEMLRKSKNVMNDKITNLTPQVTDQQKKLGKIKKVNSSVPSVKSMSTKRTNELKERPLYERIVPGVVLQTFMGNVFALDIAPQVSYRITTPWSIGAGVLYRVGFDKKYDYFAQGQGIYGFKTFIDYRLIKGLFVHGEYEKINVTRRFDYSDKTVSSAINSVYFGLGKRYPISRKFYGSLVALYKVEFGDHLPGSTKFNLRVVIEYKTKKVRSLQPCNSANSN